MAPAPRMALWLPIAALHLLLLALLTPSSRKPHGATRDAVELLLIPLPRAREPRTEPPTAQDTARTRRQEAPTTPLRREADTAAPPPAAEPEPAGVAQAPPAAAHELAGVSQPLPTAAPAATPSLLNSEGTRRAIHLATHAPLLSERAASASDAPSRETAQQRFGREVASTAYGNCLKGEYPGGGMGLLSLPFWIAAEASGKCRK